MSEPLQVKLADGRRVRDPDSNRILEPNLVYFVKPTQFWLKRAATGDVVIVEHKQVAPQAFAVDAPVSAPESQPKRKKEKLGE